MNSFEELEVYKKARELKIKISELVKHFPAEEKYRLVDQLIRASRSVTANIAEGFGRFHYQENIQFCRHSRGSLFEIIDHLICSLDEKYITNEQYLNLKNDTLFVIKLLNGYILYLKNAKSKSISKNDNSEIDNNLITKLL
ncbi:MAG: four helix bundle protein [Bacteroidetes bacterium CG02_land_8_20_14_3_00_31_25]|nr:MAG: four helix bundle protein [Bacteroidetes bacterium CG02_land_8_20_14_3_00_31_25]PIY05520.1 MAG: four helix bundle protein [Bacteroidetes bacterium CG_4_10_14_3_um_filter_31_20]